VFGGRELMIPNLEDEFSKLLARVPSDPVDEAFFAFCADNIAPAPATLTTSNLLVGVGSHQYSDSCWIDLIEMRMGRTTARSLGCLILTVLLSTEQSGTELILERDDSPIRRILLDFADPAHATGHPGLAFQPLRYGYYPGEPTRYPGKGRSDWRGLDSPWFEVTNRSRCVSDFEGRKTRDTVVMAGSATGIASFAELCLDAGRLNCEEHEFVLECPSAGFGGVAPTSAEIRLLLPGALAWALGDPPLDER